MPAWTPAKEGKDYELTPILQPLSKHRDSVSVFTGLTLDGARDHGDGAGDHARSGAAFLTGAHPRKTDGSDIKNSISIDQFAANAIGNKTRFTTLELGLEGSAQAGSCDSGYSCAYSSNLAWRNESSPLAKRKIHPLFLIGCSAMETRLVKARSEAHGLGDVRVFWILFRKMRNHFNAN